MNPEDAKPDELSFALARELCLGMGQQGTNHFEQGVKRVATALAVSRAVCQQDFLAEVERRAGATREEMLEALAEERKGGYRSAGHMRYAAWLRCILGEAK